MENTQPPHECAYKPLKTRNPRDASYGVGRKDERGKSMVKLITPGRFTAALLLAAAAAWAQGGGMAAPGAVNYTEGQVLVDGEALQAAQSSAVHPGQTLETQDGKAEILLTPGVFLRVNNNSQVRMDSNSITDTRVVLLQGEAMVEADQVIKDNGIQIIDAGYNTRIDKPGIYEFVANQPSPMLKVYDGEATVRIGDQTANAKKGHEVDLVAANVKLKTHGFDTKMTDPIYAWSKVRSEYMAEANMATAQTIVVNNPGWYAGTGWYWNPGWDSWAFIPGYGYWGSPFGFGFGFYSPVVWSVYRPVPGYFGYHGYHGVAPGYRGVAPGFRAGAPAFRNAAPSFGRGMGSGPGFAGHFGGGGRR